jgi:hypothetical protein
MVVGVLGEPLRICMDLGEQRIRLGVTEFVRLGSKAVVRLPP